MDKKIWNIINWSFLFVVTVFAVWMIWGGPKLADSNSGNNNFGNNNYSNDCTDFSEVEGFRYEACYDAYSETIFLKATRAKAAYNVRELSVSFVDTASRFHDLKDIPGAGENRAYKISADKNPGSLDVKLSIADTFNGFSCGSKSVFVDYCPVVTTTGGVDVSISPIEGVGLKDFIEVEDTVSFDSDVVSVDLADKESIWESKCKSNWDCGEWESCEDGIQHRTCKDLEGCPIPTSPLPTVQNCDGGCVEDWQCVWSSCEDGFSVPNCNDLNGCGTEYNIPDKLPCEKWGECVPDIVCQEWSLCDIDYNFIDLVGVSNISKFDGTRFRICEDKKNCVETKRESEKCSIGVDIYTKRFEKCGKEYIGVYDVLDNSTLAVLREGSGDKPYLNIYFDDQDDIYCDYCFDGRMDADETGVDCGGSCKACVDKVWEKRHWWSFLFG